VSGKKDFPVLMGEMERAGFPSEVEAGRKQPLEVGSQYSWEEASQVHVRLWAGLPRQRGAMAGSGVWDWWTYAGWLTGRGNSGTMPQSE
jgi:hypothetical protein